MGVVTRVGQQALVLLFLLGQIMPQSGGLKSGLNSTIIKPVFQIEYALERQRRCVEKRKRVVPFGAGRSFSYKLI